MENRFRSAIENGEFTVTCEVVPGRGAHGDRLEEELENAMRIWETGLVHAVSVADNPGGNPALLADEVGREFLQAGVCPLVHFTCKDRSRNQIISQLYGLERQDLENVLLMTGDYPASGWSGRSRPVFDLDSVHLQMLVTEMNAGLRVLGRKGCEVEAPTHFFNGGVVNPFKYLEGEVVPQYLKLEKKIIGGAKFVIAQLGYDARKMEELIRYRDERGYRTPFIADVFLLTRGAARLIRSGSIAGAYVSDELMAQLELEAKAPDKGKAARVERAAQMVAVAKGLGYAGVHINGFGLNDEVLRTILGRARELEPLWRDCALLLHYGKPGGYYVYEPELDADGLPTGLNSTVHAAMPERARSRDVFDNWELSRFAHYWALDLGKRGNKVLAHCMDALDEREGVYRRHGLEHVGKSMIYGCVDCGDCGLEATLYTCPMAQCPKCQRNGPCGGSYDGYCEVFPGGERYCIWYKAYHKAKRSGQMGRITSYITPPNHWELSGSSPWSAYTHERDNCAGRIPVSLGFGGAQGGVVEGTDLSKRIDVDVSPRPAQP